MNLYIRVTFIGSRMADSRVIEKKRQPKDFPYPKDTTLICWWIHFSHFVFLLLKLPMDGGGSVSDAVLVVQAIDSTGVMVV